MGKPTLEEWVAGPRRLKRLLYWLSPADGSLRMVYAEPVDGHNAGVHVIFPRLQLDSVVLGWRWMVATEIKHMRASLKRAKEIPSESVL